MSQENQQANKKFFWKAEMFVLHILEKQDCYGYEIIKIIEKKSDGEYVLKEPTLYSILKRLEKELYILSYWGDETNGGRRKYYSLTKEGKTYYKDLVTRWKKIKKISEKLLK